MIKRSVNSIKKSHKTPLPKQLQHLGWGQVFGICCLCCVYPLASHYIQFRHPGRKKPGLKREGACDLILHVIVVLCLSLLARGQSRDHRLKCIYSETTWPFILDKLDKFVATKGWSYWPIYTDFGREQPATTHLISLKSELETFLLPESSCIISSQGCVSMN